jgi:hypothetical protein
MNVACWLMLVLVPVLVLELVLVLVLVLVPVLVPIVLIRGIPRCVVQPSVLYWETSRTSLARVAMPQVPHVVVWVVWGCMGVKLLIPRVAALKLAPTSVVACAVVPV